MCYFSFLCSLHLWDSVLENFNHVQRYLQTRGLSFKKSVIEIKSLQDFLEDKINDLVEKALQFVKDMSEEYGHPFSKTKNC